MGVAIMADPPSSTSAPTANFDPAQQLAHAEQELDRQLDRLAQQLNVAGHLLRQKSDDPELIREVRELLAAEIERCEAVRSLARQVLGGR
jgi:hypothetical protein